MSVITVQREIESARNQVAPVFGMLREDEAALLWEAFGAAAAAYRSARSEGPAADRFAGVVRELIRDAKGTANNSQYRRDAGASGTVLPMPSRQPWATMPVDGSGRLNRGERVAYGVIGTLCVAVLVIIAFLLSGSGSSPDAPAVPVSLTSSVATEADTRTDSRDVDMILRGGYWSWEAATECGRGPAACDVALRRINGEAAPYGVHVWEDGSLSPLDND